MPLLVKRLRPNKTIYHVNGGALAANTSYYKSAIVCVCVLMCVCVCVQMCVDVDVCFRKL